ncbi:MAG: anaerobic ribonucleoside-triphosphate reductase activating protein [Clostridia bacterium]|nr:anaerobic ribonucleoside-triphosphate reductase activating protein [Clostridia bacterium]
MNIQGYQKLTLLDFPGRVACTVFTGGCNLRCPFCHNAGLVRTPFSSANSEEELLSYLVSRRGLLDGVCVTGGEPLLQPDLPVFLQRVKDMGYSVKLDTNGSLPDKLAALLASGLVDYVAMDVKSSPAGYAAATGRDGDVAPFLQSIRLLEESGIPHEFRTTVVKGIHTAADIEAIGQLLAGCARYFLQPFRDSGNLLGDGCSAFSEAEMSAFLDIAKKYIPAAQLRGQG